MRMDYYLEEQLNIVAAMEEISPAGMMVQEVSDLEENELDMETLSLVTAAQSLPYESFLKKAKEHPAF